MNKIILLICLTVAVNANPIEDAIKANDAKACKFVRIKECDEHPRLTEESQNMFKHVKDVGIDEKWGPCNADVKFMVGYDGMPYRIRIVRTDNKKYNAAIIKLINYWRFIPAVKNGKNVSTEIWIPLTFMVNGKWNHDLIADEEVSL